MGGQTPPAVELSETDEKDGVPATSIPVATFTLQNL